MFSQLLKDTILENLQDQKDRYVFYSDGSWQAKKRLPSLVDFHTFYVITQGSSYAVTF